MLNPEQPVFYPDRYDEHGKWMDGWETRRRRTTGHDWCIVRLAMPGVLMGVDFDTSFFTGNFPPAASWKPVSVPVASRTNTVTGSPWCRPPSSRAMSIASAP